MTPARRFLVVGLAIATAEGALGLLALPTGLGGYLFACAAATAVLALAARRLVVGPPDEPDDDGRGGGGGPPDEPPPPPWWPDFEAAFRAHAAARAPARGPRTRDRV